MTSYLMKTIETTANYC